MAKVKNVTGEDRIVPWLGGRLVMAGQVVEVPDEDSYAYTVSAGWEPADDAAQEIHDRDSVAAVAAQIEADGVPVEQPAEDAPREVWGGYVLAAGIAEPEDLAGLDRDQIREEFTKPATQPGGGASREEWVEWVVGNALATGEDLEGMGRDAIRDTYKQEG